MKWIKPLSTGIAAFVGVSLALGGLRSIGAQSGDGGAGDPLVRCRQLVGVIEDCAMVKVDTSLSEYGYVEGLDGPRNQTRSEYYWTAIPAVGLGPQNVIEISKYDATDRWRAPSGSAGDSRDLYYVWGPRIGDGVAYLLWKYVLISRYRETARDDENNLIWSPWSDWHSNETVCHSGPFKVHVTYCEALAVSNPGDGKSLRLDWGGIVPGEGVKGYQIWRRERPDLE